MIRLLMYLAVGAVFHLIFVGQYFDFHSALTWLWLFGWPLMLWVWMGVIGVAVGAVCLLAFGAYKLVKG